MFWCLFRVLGKLGDKVGDLLLEVVPGVDVIVAELEAGREDHEADVLLARLPRLLVQAGGQGVRHDGVILRGQDQHRGLKHRGRWETRKNRWRIYISSKIFS